MDVTQAEQAELITPTHHEPRPLINWRTGAILAVAGIVIVGASAVIGFSNAAAKIDTLTTENVALTTKIAATRTAEADARADLNAAVAQLQTCKSDVVHLAQSGSLSAQALEQLRQGSLSALRSDYPTATSQVQQSTDLINQASAELDRVSGTCN